MRGCRAQGRDGAQPMCADSSPRCMCSGRGHYLPPLQSSLTFRDVSRTYRTSGIPSAPTLSLSVSLSSSLSLCRLSTPPSPLSVQVAERILSKGCSLSSPAHGQRSLELPPSASAPGSKVHTKTVLLLTPGLRIKGYNCSYFLFIFYYRYFQPREKIQLCSMRNHAHHLVSQCAAVRLLPADLPHPHQR